MQPPLLPALRPSAPGLLHRTRPPHRLAIMSYLPSSSSSSSSSSSTSMSLSRCFSLTLSPPSLYLLLLSSFLSLSLSHSLLLFIFNPLHPSFWYPSSPLPPSLTVGVARFVDFSVTQCAIEVSFPLNRE